MSRPAAWSAGMALLLASAPVSAGAQGTLERERAEFVRWLTTSPVSPAAAVAHRPLQDGVTLGPDGSDLPVDGLGPHRLGLEGGAVILVGEAGRRPSPADVRCRWAGGRS